MMDFSSPGRPLPGTAEKVSVYGSTCGSGSTDYWGYGGDVSSLRPWALAPIKPRRLRPARIYGQPKMLRLPRHRPRNSSRKRHVGARLQSVFRGPRTEASSELTVADACSTSPLKEQCSYRLVTSHRKVGMARHGLLQFSYIRFPTDQCAGTIGD
jgi:hypothetical protein